MTPRENMLSVFRHEMPEWIPLFAACDGYNQPNRAGMDPETVKALADGGDGSDIAFSRCLDTDIFSMFGPPIRSRRNRVTIEYRQEGRDTSSTWHTPHGDLVEVTRKGVRGAAAYRMKHLLERPEDIPALASVFEDETFEVNPDRVAALKARRELVGQNGMIAFPMPGTPLGMLIRVYAGPAHTSYLHADAPDALRDLFSVMQANYLRQFRLALQFDADAVLSMDDTSTTTQSPAMFEQYCVDYTDAAADVTHAAGKYYLHHSCGHIRDLLGLYNQTEMDGVHAFCPPPLGNATVRQGRERLGNKIIFATLIQMFVLTATRDWIRESVRQMFREAAPGDNVIFGIAGDPMKTLEDTRFVREECRQYQRLG
jgi:hypothetical protein